MKNGEWQMANNGGSSQKKIMAKFARERVPWRGE